MFERSLRVVKSSCSIPFDPIYKRHFDHQKLMQYISLNFEVDTSKLT